jgi:HD-GYP domain-containing protein (c-di-GMP phosphodiesterase class II)
LEKQIDDRCEEKETRLSNIPLRVAVIYMLLGGLWILTSDLIIIFLVNDLLLLTILQTYKGWLFILVTTFLLYAILKRDLRNLENVHKNLIEAYDATIAGWSKAMDLRDQETEGHSERVVNMTICLAKQMGMSCDDLEHVRRGALLHDMGKLGVPDSILLKNDLLTENEWRVMRSHPLFAFKMFSSIDYLRPALDIPYCHHEKWDGSGYPRGLRNEEIPLSARIFAVVDVWDALTSDRHYHKAWSKEKALKYIEEQKGKHFDPMVVDKFKELLELDECDFWK